MTFVAQRSPRNFGKRFLPADKAEADVLATKDDAGGLEGVWWDINGI